MIIGTLFALSFSSESLIYALWSGLFAFIGAESLYQAFSDKIFKPFAEMDRTIKIERDDNNE